jgi:hypothetical protein
MTRQIKILNKYSDCSAEQQRLNNLQAEYNIKYNKTCRPLIPLDRLGKVIMLCPDTGYQLSIKEYIQILLTETTYKND